MDYTNLAKRIKYAGKEIAKDHINKDYLLECTYRDTIIVRSDSGFEAIIIGDIDRNDIGYMYLYYNNTSKRNSYPTQTELTKLLKSVAEKQMIEEGEGKAAYCFYDNVDRDTQLEYFANIVKRMASEEVKHC